MSTDWKKYRRQRDEARAREAEAKEQVKAMQKKVEEHERARVWACQEAIRLKSELETGQASFEKAIKDGEIRITSTCLKCNIETDMTASVLEELEPHEN